MILICISADITSSLVIQVKLLRSGTAADGEKACSATPQPDCHSLWCHKYAHTWTVWS